MQVKTSGFVLDFDGISTTEFLNYLKGNMTYVYQNRLLILDKIKNEEHLWGGYLLTLRDEKTIPLTKLTGDELEVILQTIGDKNTHHSEYNFFLINTETGKGLFQTYFRSAPWSFFSFYLGHRFNSLARDLKPKEVNLKSTALFRQGSFEEYLEQFEWIKEVSVEASKYEVRENAFRRLDDEAQRRIEIFKFYKTFDWNLGKIKEALSDIFNKKQVEDLKIQGTIAGIETVYTLANNVEVFHYEEYDNWIKSLTFSSRKLLESVNKSQTIKNLIRIYYETLLLTRLDKKEKVV